MVFFSLCASVMPALTLHQFRWHLPLVDAYDLEHCALLRQGIRTQWPEEVAAADHAAARTAKKLRQLLFPAPPPPA